MCLFICIFQTLNQLPATISITGKVDMTMNSAILALIFLQKDLCLKPNRSLCISQEDFIRICTDCCPSLCSTCDKDLEKL